MSVHQDSARSAEPFPVQSQVAVTEKSGVSIVVHSYSNRYFVIVSEAGSQGLGTVIQVSKYDQPDGFDIEPTPTVYDINIRFGNETPELLLAARILASQVNFDKPILFGLALRGFSKDTLGEVSDELNKILKTLQIKS